MDAVRTNVSFPKLEERILQVWKEKKIFERSMHPNAPTQVGEESGAERPKYVFYDGPPFATGLPHYGHLLAGTIKDVVGRFFTMKGFHVDRRFGWDCHGVPVEFEIQKKLDLHGAKAIREFGVGRFNEACREIVLRFTQEWERFVIRSGRWVDFERQYRTMDLDFMESIWWVVQTLWQKGLIYEGVKCVPYSWAINTPLSNFEANLNYKTVQDPAVTLRFRCIGEPLKQLGIEQVPPHTPVSLYVWTTTPWTLPSNMAVAVHPEILYSAVFSAKSQEVAIVATVLLGEHFPELSTKSGDDKPLDSYVLCEIPGAKLVGLSYQPLFPYFEKERAQGAFQVYAGEFVLATDGTGLVHLASFGEDDLSVFQRHKIPIIDPVDEDGSFLPEVTDFAGLNIKAADSKIVAHLRNAGQLVSHKTIEHSYPFCWRTDTPLIYKSISTWFVKVESIRESLLKSNAEVHWVPEHLRDGRMGNWLEGARDWAISRNRFWGTPIPVWRCESCNVTECLGSVRELEEKTGAKVSDLHSHFIDPLTYSCSACSGTMKRIPEVLDCWFESGSMPYAQSHYPFEGKKDFETSFPADFIAEGLDQTRGWFYTLLILSTILFKKPAFKNVIVNGILLAEDGKKMSKSLQNYPPPDEVMEECGADAMRLYLLASAATRAEDLRFSKRGVQEVVRQTLLPLWNAYNFFVTYALVDQWSPTKSPKESSPNLLDRWILSKTASLVQGVDAAMNQYHLYAAPPQLLDFVDQLTNWYIRLNRRRFWSGDSAAEQQDKFHAYATLHTALLTFVRVLAPLAPFVSEEIFLNLKKGVPHVDFESVHLAPFPHLEESRGLQVDSELETAMKLFEDVILLGRSLRNEHGLKVRQPLAALTVIHPDESELTRLRLLDSYLREELNVKSIVYTSEEEAFVTLHAQLNTKELGKVLGPKLGANGMKALRQEVESLSTDDLRQLERGEVISLQGLELTQQDVLLKRAIKPGLKAAASSGQITISLDTHVTPELRLEGYSREFVNRVQKLRKDFDFNVSDRIVVRFMTACNEMVLALVDYKDYVMQETLAVDIQEVRSESALRFEGATEQLPSAQEIEGHSVIISITRVQA